MDNKMSVVLSVHNYLCTHIPFHSIFSSWVYFSFAVNSTASSFFSMSKLPLHTNKNTKIISMDDKISDRTNMVGKGQY